MPEGNIPSGVWLAKRALPVPASQRLHAINLWCDFGVFGLSFYDDQTPWFTLIEFIQIVTHLNRAGLRVLPGLYRDAEGNPVHETLNYEIPVNQNVRHLLFRDKEVARLAGQPTADAGTLWNVWLEHVHQSFSQMDFNYLRAAFSNDFLQFAEALDLLRSAEVEKFGSRRWTSRHLLPLGPAMLFADVKTTGDNSYALDRRFFQRTGEMLWLMLNRANLHAEVSDLIVSRLLGQEHPWNRIAERVQGPEANYAVASKLPSTNIGYLPIASHPVYDRLAEDWAAILNLHAVPVEDCLDCLMRLSALHEVVYIVERACNEMGKDLVPPFVLDLANTARSNPVYGCSSESYKTHRSLPLRAVETYVARYAESEEWCGLGSAPAISLRAAQMLHKRFLWKPARTANPLTLRPPEAQLDDLIAATKARNHDVGSAFTAHARRAGLVVARRAAGTWYSPSDGMLEALVLANVRTPLELTEFLEKLKERYRIVIGPEEARTAKGELPAPMAALKKNEQKLEERLRVLGFIDRKSDDCAFVINPFCRERAVIRAAA